MLELFLSLALGIGLSAACGFRVFVPLLVISAAARGGFLTLAPGFEWMGSYPALLSFAVATVVEILAYYVPWVDNALDGVATPAAVVAGAVITASMVTGVDPWLQWTLAVIAGGGAAGIVQAGTTVLRGLSTLTTGGFGNFVVSTLEWIGAFTTSLLAVLFPVVALLLVLGLIVFILTRWGRRTQPAANSAH
ncbi:MAG: DUF4126 family protein [Caldilineaceae bacterium]|nr:DUF4126 family protein [Caldilineaceae bacterium]